MRSIFHCRWLLSIGIVFFATEFAIAEPLFEKTDVFPSRQDGYHHVRIPGLVVTRRGALLAFGEARHADQGGGDWADIDLVLRRSSDGGKTWSKLQVLEDGTRYARDSRNKSARRKKGQGEFVTCNNPVMIVDREGEVVHFLYCVEYDRCFYCRSDDDGLTFSDAVEITPTFDGFRTDYAWNVLATGPGHGLQLTNSRLVVPVWLSTGTGGGGHRPSCVSTIYSDDHGKSWHRGEIAVNHPDLLNPSETVAEQLADGRTMLNIRSENHEHRRTLAYSADGATGWSRPVLNEQLFDPVCMASMIRFSGNGLPGKGRLLFCNPTGSTPRDGKPADNPTLEREDISVKLSYDEGQTWPVSKTIERGGSGYSDLAVDATGRIHCLYERGGTRDAFDPEALTCATFNLEWLTDGKDKGAAK